MVARMLEVMVAVIGKTVIIIIQIKFLLSPMVHSFADVRTCLLVLADISVWPNKIVKRKFQN